MSPLSGSSPAVGVDNWRQPSEAAAWGKWESPRKGGWQREHRDWPSSKTHSSVPEGSWRRESACQVDQRLQRTADTASRDSLSSVLSSTHTKQEEHEDCEDLLCMGGKAVAVSTAAVADVAFDLSSELLATGIAVVRKIHDMEAVHQPPQAAPVAPEDDEEDTGSSKAATGSPPYSPRSEDSLPSCSVSRSRTTSDLLARDHQSLPAPAENEEQGLEHQHEHEQEQEQEGRPELMGVTPKRRRKHKGRLAPDWEKAMGAQPPAGSSASPSSHSPASSCCGDMQRERDRDDVAELPPSASACPTPAAATVPTPLGGNRALGQGLSPGSECSWLCPQGVYTKFEKTFKAGDPVQVFGLVHYTELNFHFAWARSLDPQKEERWIVQLWDGRQVNLPASNLRLISVGESCESFLGAKSQPLGTARLRSLSRQLKTMKDQADPVLQVRKVRADLEACFVDPDTAFSGRAMALLAAARAADRKLVEVHQCRARISQLLEKGERMLSMNVGLQRSAFSALRLAQAVLSTNVDPVTAGAVPLQLLESEADMLASMI